MKVVTYRRVSTAKQDRSGLGIEAQQDYIAHAITAHGLEVVGEFIDSGVSGGMAPGDRMGLSAALALCKEKGACLLVAKLDRLSRSVKDIATLMEQVCVRVATMMQADNFQLHLFAALAEQEKAFIQSRTRDALASLKARAAGGDVIAQGKVKTWSDNIAKAHESGINRKRSIEVRSAKAHAFASTVEDNILAARSRGHSTLQAVADYLNGKGIVTRRGTSWTPTAVKRVVTKMAE